MGRNWAIAIGINTYDNLQSLSYANRDAAAMRDYFVNEAGFEQVYYFAEDAPDIELDYGPPFKPFPTFAKLDRFLDIRFENQALGSGDNVWFFFAGHGKRHKNRDYLLPSDVNPRNLERTALSIAALTERLRRCGADNVILLLDACRNEGNEGDRDGEGIGNEQQKGVVTLFSCSPNERSYEIDQLQHGSFTYTLLQGLRTQGEGNCATVERLDQHLRYQVPELNRRYAKPTQTPYTNAEPIAKRHLILLPKQATLADVTILKNDALEAEAEQDYELAEQLWVRVLTVSPGDRQAIKAIQRLAVKVASMPNRPAPSAAPVAGRSTTVPTPPVAPPPTPTIPSFEFEVVTVDAKGQENSRKRGQAQYFTEDLGAGVGLDLVSIPGGSFQMGSAEGKGEANERPQHSVTVKPFLIGKYPVTQAQWKRAAALPKVQTDLDSDPAGFKGENRPIEQVSWHDAIEFCARLSQKTRREYRLPTEAEWEYACRAGTSTPFHFGDTITTGLANYDGNYTWASAPKGNYRKQTTDVGRFFPNAFGLHDMHGNVWEWCLDRWHSDYKGAPINESAWITNGSSSRLLRGGSWFNNPRLCRSANRSGYDPDVRYNGLGFRVVSPSAWTL